MEFGPDDGNCIALVIEWFDQIDGCGESILTGVSFFFKTWQLPGLIYHTGALSFVGWDWPLWCSSWSRSSTWISRFWLSADGLGIFCQFSPSSGSVLASWICKRSRSCPWGTCRSRGARCSTAAAPRSDSLSASLSRTCCGSLWLSRPFYAQILPF